MQDGDKIIGLIEQAASAINVLSPTELSEVESLQKILDELNSALSEVEDAPAELLKQAKGATSKSVKSLEKILKKKVKTTTKTIESVTEAIITLQELIDQITQPASPSVSKTEESPAEGGGTFISEDDAPLVVDFIAEAGEHLESSEAGLLELEEE